MPFGNVLVRRKSLEAAYEAPGSRWRLHLKGERYAVAVKVTGVVHGDQAAVMRG